MLETILKYYTCEKCGDMFHESDGIPFTRSYDPEAECEAFVCKWCAEKESENMEAASVYWE